MQRLIPVLICVTVAVFAPSPAAAETTRVFVSDKVSSPFAPGNTDVQAAEITPDGRHALFVQTKTDDQDSGGTLYSVPVSGGDPVALADGIQGEGRDFEATPDSQHAIAVRRATGGQSTLHSIPISGGIPRSLGTSDIPFKVRPPQVFGGGSTAVDFVMSPSGSHVAFANLADGLISAPVGNGPPVAVSLPVEFVSGIGFSPDSQALYFVGNPGGGAAAAADALYAVPADGYSPPSPLFVAADGVTPLPAGSNPHLLPDGSAIVSTTGTGSDLSSIQKFVIGAAAATTIAELPDSPATVHVSLIYAGGGSHLFVVTATSRQQSSLCDRPRTMARCRPMFSSN